MWKFALVLLLTIKVSDSNKKDPLPAYDEVKDGIKMLKSNHFKDVVYNSETAWLVEFYSRWCGHCKSFALTYKQFSQNISNWNGVVRLAAVDCIDKGNDFDNGLELCFRPPFFVSGMPDLRFIPAHTSDKSTNGGIKRPHEGKKTFGSNGVLLSDSDSAEHLLNFTIDKLTDNLPPNSPLNLKCLKKDVLAEVLGNKQKYNLAIVIESKKSRFGRQLILDLSSYSNISIYRVSDKNKKALSLLANEADYNHESSPMIIVRENTQYKQITGSHDKCLKLLMSLPGVVGGRDEQVIISNVKSGVFAQDLENAVMFTMQREIGGLEYVKGRPLQALKDYLEMLSQYYPGRENVMLFIDKLHSEIDALLVGETLGWSTWQEMLDRADKAADETILDNIDDEYEGCDGSRADLRGFPCALWQLFHMMSVQSYNRGVDSDWSVGLLIAMREYITTFFTCMSCRTHWSAATQDLSDLNSSRDAVLYLWRKHNEVNLRLSGSLTDDPVYPKQLWPAPELCPQCWKDSMNFDEEEVLVFLLNYYSPGNFQEKSEVIEPSPMKDEL